MQIAIESTDQVTDLDGVPCRVWKGVTAAGVPCTLFVHRIAVDVADNFDEFAAELSEQLPPTSSVPLIDVLKATSLN